ncbi:tetratricopeptide repeat protein [Oscillatoria amoena NRMC-F 0135]|nr:tetratricopeptide repeat protein [Oscillatoria amoena NRMC-F 0135]
MKIPYIYILSVVVLVACSPQSNTFTSKAFHNTTAHYNGYYYAREEITKIEGTIRKNHKDDYNRVLKLFPPLDSVLAKSYDKEIQEAIKMASIAIQRHPHSKWVDDSYVLVGKARLYSFDWGNAIQTFKFVNTKGEELHTRHEALIWLARTFTEHGEYNNAEATFDFLQKEKLNKTNLKKFYLEKAHYYQVRGDDNNFVKNLTEAVPLLKKKDRPGRIYFILGQVYQQLGFEAEAYNYFRKCLDTHPEYEVDFYARLYMAQVAEISKSRSIATARKSFKKLLKDSKNKAFKDKIYYEMGVFERKQKNINEALATFELALREGNNAQINGEAYLQMGEIYYDTLKNYEFAKLYYDSAVANLSKDHEDFDAVKTRQEILAEFVTHLKTISWQDSLLVMAKMDSASLMAHITKTLESNTEPETKSRKKKKRNRIDIGQVNSSLSTTGSLEGTDWYFGNPSALALGQQEFRRIWGNIPLEDNWRRSSRAVPASQRTNVETASNTPAKEETTTTGEAAQVDPVLEAYNRISKELPKTEEQVVESLAKIEAAYFFLGDIYYFKLLEKENAVTAYETLLQRFPQTDYRPEVLYKLYLMHKDPDGPRAERYARELKENFPESTFAKILVNPDYLLESSQVVEKQKALYKQAYNRFETYQLDSALSILNEALALEKTAFTPNLELLKILTLGKTDEIARYQYRLEEFIKQYPETEITAYAQKLLKASRDFELRREKERGIKYIPSFDEPHYFVIIYPTKIKLEDIASKALDGFNQSNFASEGLKVSNLIFDETHSITFVSGLNARKDAQQYYRTFIEKQPTLNTLKPHKFDTFVITKNNFDIFYRTKGLHEYLQFFEKKLYPKKSVACWA